MRWDALALCTAALIVGVATASAQPAREPEPGEGRPLPVPVDWSAPPACPDRTAFVAEIERLLGRALEQPTPTRVQGAISAAAGGYRLELVLERQGTRSERALEDASCVGLALAGAFAVAVALDPDVALEAEPTPPPGEHEEVPSEPEPEAVAPSGDPAPSSRASSLSPPRASGPEPPSGSPADSPSDRDRGARPLRFVARASGVLSAGPLPDLGGGGMLALGFGIDDVELTLGGYALAPRAARVSDAAGGVVGLAAGQLRACASGLVDPALELSACGAFEVGAAWASGEGVPIVRSGAAPWVAFAAELGARWWLLESFGLELHAALQVPVYRAPFVITLEGERREVHRAFEVGGLFGAGLVFRVR